MQKVGREVFNLLAQLISLSSSVVSGLTLLVRYDALVLRKDFIVRSRWFVMPKDLIYVESQHKTRTGKLNQETRDTC